METCGSHTYQDIEEVQSFRSNLLRWYDQNKRELPWRTLALTECDVNIRAYGVWVSEVMLQQTQVATVIGYYKKWMSKWPTVESLAAARLEEVHAVWAGLGYYSRGKRLWEGAKKVVSEMGGVIPDSPEELMKKLPGVGKYTAGAITSIAFNKVASIVDGNVARVLSRQRIIGGKSDCREVVKHIWELSEVCVDQVRPGDFNQALMELGATLCTPKSPYCQDCPIASSCLAFKQMMEVPKNSITCDSNQESKKKCSLCLVNWNSELGVMNYPHKPKKKLPPTEEFSVAIIEDTRDMFLLRQRPSTGLLAGMWEFPSILTVGGRSHDQMWEELHQGVLSEGSLKGRYSGKVTHHFSHVHHLYHCWHIVLDNEQQKCQLMITSDSEREARWMNRRDLDETAVPAAVKKIVKLLDTDGKTASQKRSCQSPVGGSYKNAKRQKTLNSFFKKQSV